MLRTRGPSDCCNSECHRYVIVAACVRLCGPELRGLSLRRRYQLQMVAGQTVVEHSLNEWNVDVRKRRRLERWRGRWPRARADASQWLTTSPVADVWPGAEMLTWRSPQLQTTLSPTTACAAAPLVAVEVPLAAPGIRHASRGLHSSAIGKGLNWTGLVLLQDRGCVKDAQGCSRVD
jgi:hypothetical protein